MTKATRRLLMAVHELIADEPDLMGDPDDAEYAETALGSNMKELYEAVVEFEKEVV